MTLAKAQANGLVSGPASSTDHAIVRFDGTTGKLLQNSGITIDDNDYMRVPATGRIEFRDAQLYIASDADILAFHADGYVRTGSGTMSQGLGADGDFLVSGKLEVDGTAYLDNGGLVYSNKKLEFRSSGSWVASDANNILGLHGTQYVRVGNGSTSHAISGDGCLLVSDKLEVDGTAYFDANAQVTSTNQLQFRDAQIYIASLNDAYGDLVADTGWRVTGTLSCAGAGANSERFGAGTTASGEDCTVLGNGASATAVDCVVIGKSASGAGNRDIVIGEGSTCTGADNVIVGRDVDIGALTNVIAIGNVAVGGGSSVVIGHSANDQSKYASVCIGLSADGQMAVGSGASTGTYLTATAVGKAASVVGNSGTAIGDGATANGDATAVGKSCSATGLFSTALGSGTSDGGNARCICLGYNADATAANQMVIGSASGVISDAYIGEGVVSATPSAVIFQSTGGSGTNIAGADFTIAAGKGTGSANGGTLTFSTAPAGGAGSSLNALVARLAIDSTGDMTFSAGAANKMYLRDTDIYIASLNDGYLDLEADTGVRINGDAFVGIGAPTPTAPLDIEHSLAGTDDMVKWFNTIQGDGANTKTRMSFSFSNNASAFERKAGYIEIGKASTYVSSGTTQNYIAFATNNGLVEPAERVRITAPGGVGIGTDTVPHVGVGAAKLAIEGTDANVVGGPHLQITTDLNDYPLVQWLNWQHDDISWAVDAYYDGTWKSADAGSNFRFHKNGDLFKIQADASIAQGGAITWTTAMYITSDGDVVVAAGKDLDCATNGAYFKPRRVRQAAQPTPDAGELMVWCDSDDDSVHLVYNDADGGVAQWDEV